MTAVVVSTNFTLVVGYGDSNSPLIGYDNKVTESNIAATDSASGYPVTNLGNVSTAEEWRANSTGVKYLTCTMSGESVDYVGVAKHNFGSAGIAVSVETYDGSVWTEVCEAVFLPDDAPVIFRFDEDAPVGVRLKLAAGSSAPRCAIMYVGLLLKLQRNLYVGHTPINLASDPTVITGMSEEANFLGRVTTGRSAGTTIALQNLTPGWYRTYMKPFLRAAETTPFFFAWRPQGYPREVGFTWIAGKMPVPQNQRPNGMMKIDLSLRGIIS